MSMSSRVDQEKVQILLKRVGLNDREIGERIGVNQSTIWRLRHRYIKKVDRYLEALSRVVGDPQPDGTELDLERLVALAEQSPGLKAVLLSLKQFMQEDASKR